MVRELLNVQAAGAVRQRLAASASVATVLSSVPASRTGCRHSVFVSKFAVFETADGTFCCHGCASVFRFLEDHGLTHSTPATPVPASRSRGRQRDAARFAALDDPAVASGSSTRPTATQSRRFAVPSIHCASCVWLLEQLWRFDRRHPALRSRSACGAPCASTFQPAARSACARSPNGSPRSATSRVIDARARCRPRCRRRGATLYLQARRRRLRVRQHHAVQHPALRQRRAARAGVPAALRRAQHRCSRCRCCSSAPSDYFRSAWQALRSARDDARRARSRSASPCSSRAASSTSSTGRGEGFLDSFAGLVFFLLIGRLFQQKAFDRIAFDRTFRSFLPLSVRVERGDDASS